MHNRQLDLFDPQLMVDHLAELPAFALVLVGSRTSEEFNDSFSRLCKQKSEHYICKLSSEEFAALLHSETKTQLVTFISDTIQWVSVS